MDVIIDSLMVIQSRKFPVGGSEQLQTFSWVMAACGSIVGALIASYLTEQPNPRYCFLINSVVGLAVAIYSFCLSP